MCFARSTASGPWLLRFLMFVSIGDGLCLTLRLSLRDLREKFEAMKEEEARKTPTTPSGTKVKELQRLQSDPNFRSTFREMAALWKEKEEENPPVNRPRAGSLSTTLPVSEPSLSFPSDPRSPS